MDHPSRGEMVDELSSWNVGAGILTMSLFPLALPGIVLLLVAAIPLLALALPLLVIGGVGIGVFRLMRGFARVASGLRFRRRVRAGGEAVPVRPVARRT